MVASSPKARRPRSSDDPAVIEAYLGRSVEHDLLVLESVVAAYDDVVCSHGVSLEVRRGEIVTLIGANGAGKSTTLKTISGLLAPAHGKIAFDGRDITGRMPDRSWPPAWCRFPKAVGCFPGYRSTTICGPVPTGA